MKNGARTITRFIDAVRAQTYPRVELIIVDNHSTDGSTEICRSRADKFFTLGPERSAQRNKALQEAAGEYVLIVDADQYLTRDVVAECVATVDADSTLHGLVIPEETIALGFWGACKKFERDFYLVGDASAEAARFFRRSEVLAIGGYDERQTGSEDWDLSDRMLATYGNLGRIASRIVHDEVRLGHTRAPLRGRELAQHDLQDRQTGKIHGKTRIIASPGRLEPGRGPARASREGTAPCRFP